MANMNEVFYPISIVIVSLGLSYLILMMREN